MFRRKKGKTEGITVSPYTSIEIIDGNKKRGGGTGTFLLTAYLFLFFTGVAYACISLAELPVSRAGILPFCLASSLVFGIAAFGTYPKGIFLWSCFFGDRRHRIYRPGYPRLWVLRDCQQGYC